MNTPLKPCDCPYCAGNIQGPWMIPADNTDGDHHGGISPEAWGEMIVE